MEFTLNKPTSSKGWAMQDKTDAVGYSVSGLAGLLNPTGEPQQKAETMLTRHHTNHQQTIGVLEIEGFRCHTLENPWRGNDKSVSCIPDGTYRLEYRRSPLIQRLTDGEFEGGYEIVPVEGRSYIMIHPGNWVRDTQGCILVGGEPQIMAGELAVPDSMATFRRFMQHMDGRDSIEVQVRWELDEFPRYTQ